jgi:hypothetical protein
MTMMMMMAAVPLLESLVSLCVFNPCPCVGPFLSPCIYSSSSFVVNALVNCGHNVDQHVLLFIGQVCVLHGGGPSRPETRED